MAGYFDPRYETHADVMRKRQIAEAMAGKALSTPSNVGEGMNAVAAAIIGRAMENRANKAEAAGRSGASEAFSALLGGMGGSQPAPSTVESGPQMDYPSARVDSASGGTAGTEWLKYVNQGATRNQPVSPELAKALSFLPELGVSMEVFSGGQPGINEGGARVGSTRHDHGNAADVFFYKDGRKLDWANPDDLPIFQDIVRRGKEAGITGFGAGDGYMQPGSMHVGFGKEAVWGAGGKGANAPDWLTQAYSSPRQQVAQAMSNQPVQVAGDTWAGLRQPTQAQAPQQPQGGGMQPLVDFLSNPWATDGQKAVAQALLERQMQQSDPRYQLETQQLRNEIITGAPDYVSPVDRANIGLNREKFDFERGQAGLTDDLREYDRYAAQERAAGREPLGVMDFMIRMKQSGAANTNVTVNGEPADGNLRKKLDEKTGELWSTYQEQGANSAAMAQDMQVMDELIQLAPQGPLTGRLAEAFPGFSAAGDAFQSIVKRVAPTLRAPGSGSTSDIEYDGMLRALPALRNKPEANALIAEIMKAKAQINIERSNIVNDYSTGDLSAKKARELMADLNSRSILTPEMEKALAGLTPQSGPEIGTVEDGYRFRGGDPSDPNNWEATQ